MNNAENSSMSFSVVAQEHLGHDQIDFNGLDPRFRRATPNMIASTMVCEKILNNKKPKNLSIIYATHFGEIAASADYLLSLEKENLAKPILFQNSLHNSTLGFLCIALGQKGPALTISADQHMNQAIADAADGLACISDSILICLSDSVPPNFEKSYSEIFSHIRHNFNKSSAFLFEKQTNIDSESIPAAAWRNIKFY